MIRRTAALLLTGWLIACGGSVSGETGGSAGSSGSSGHSSDLASACRSFFRAHQGWFTRCGPGYGSAPETEDAYVATCASLLALPGVTVTVADVDACTAQVGIHDSCDMAPPCVTSRSPIDLPASDSPGTLARGEACLGASQCASGECAWFTAGEVCGVCVERRSEGQSCGLAAQLCREGMTCLDGVCGWAATKPGETCVRFGSGACPSGLYCDAPEEGDEGACQLRPGPGEACSAIANFACREHLYCLEGTCVDLVAPGASCDEEHLCQAGFYCHEGRCQSPHYNVSLGGDCSFDQCATGLVCSPDVTCQQAEVAGEGDECSFDRVCGAGLVCSRGYLPSVPAGHCVKAPVAGGPCVDLECGPLARCVDFQLSDGNPGQCVALHGVGQACPCIDPLACVDGVCQPLGSPTCP